jgi:hypothetical protein
MSISRGVILVEEAEPGGVPSEANHAKIISERFEKALKRWLQLAGLTLLHATKGGTHPEVLTSRLTTSPLSYPIHNIRCRFVASCLLMPLLGRLVAYYAKCFVCCLAVHESLLGPG